MSPNRRIQLFVMVMSLIVLIVEVFAIGILYQTALGIEKKRLEEKAKSQARLIEAIARFDRKYSVNYPYGHKEATLDQIREAHARYGGFGDTGEFTLSIRRGDEIVFLLRHRHDNLDKPKPVPWRSDLAQPMRLALSGESGSMVGLDYRGVEVLAAHEPVSELGLGIVAKLDLAEVRAPFAKAIWLSCLITVAVIALGIAFTVKLTRPVLQGLRKTVADLEEALREVKTLQGILPICAFCKKIRDDEGYWNQVEVYIKHHSDAHFTHGVCPGCLEEHYPEQFASLKRKNDPCVAEPSKPSE